MLNNKNKANKFFTSTLTIIVLLALCGFISFNENVKAAGLSNLSDTLSSLKATTASAHTITFTMTDSLLPNETITVDFNEDGGGFIVAGAASTVSDFDFNNEGETTIVGVDDSCVGHAGTSDIAVGINDTTGVVTFRACGSYGNQSNTVTIRYGSSATSGGTGTNRVTNPSSGSKTISIGGTFGDTGQIGIAIITDDDIDISATVDQTMTFTISIASLTFGTFPDTAVRWATDGGNGSASEPAADNPTKITAFSNANNGITLTISSAGDGSSNAGLYSLGALKLIPAVGANTVAGNNEHYAAYAKNKTGSAGLAIAAGFNGGASTTALTRSPQTIASSSGPTDTASFDLAVKAAVKGNTPAGTYNDILTISCTPSY